MDEKEIQEIFENTLKGNNFMTPNVIRFGQSGDFLYELAEGTGFNREPRFGITVLELLEDGTIKHRTDLGKVFNSLLAAESHAEDLETI